MISNIADVYVHTFKLFNFLCIGTQQKLKYFCISSKFRSIVCTWNAKNLKPLVVLVILSNIYTAFSPSLSIKIP